MAEYLSLLEFLRELVSNVGLRDRFAEDPQGALRDHGLDHLGPEDVHDALVLAEDNQTADFSLDYAGGHSTIGDAEPLLPGESGHEAAVRYLTTYVSHNAGDLDATAFGAGGDPGIGDAGAFATGDHTWTDETVSGAYDDPFATDPDTTGSWDDDGHRPYLDEDDRPPHPDHGLDHPVDGH
jgi:hypothetical protein